MRCCARDEGWPFGATLRGGAPNHRVLRWLKTVVVNDTEKAHMMRQVGIRMRIPSHSVHPFRSNPYTDSDVFVHPLRRLS
jgi:hypothetical protein